VTASSYTTIEASTSPGNLTTKPFNFRPREDLTIVKETNLTPRRLQALLGSFENQKPWVVLFSGTIYVDPSFNSAATFKELFDLLDFALFASTISSQLAVLYFGEVFFSFSVFGLNINAFQSPSEYNQDLHNTSALQPWLKFKAMAHHKLEKLTHQKRKISINLFSAPAPS